MKHLTFQVAWDRDANEYRGTCLQYPGLSHFDETIELAIKGITDLCKFVEEANPSIKTVQFIRYADKRTHNWIIEHEGNSDEWLIKEAAADLGLDESDYDDVYVWHGTISASVNNREKEYNLK